MNYDNYARLFDRIFPLDEETVNFLKEEFRDRNRILDLCCGRGLYTNALSDTYDISGVDISPKMIGEAVRQFPDIPFSVRDMRSFEGVYQGIFIIGNSLVHLDSYDEIKKECGYLYEHLEKHGKLVIQILNYDLIYKKQIRRLPEINREGIRFIREYELNEEKVIFNSELLYGDTGFKQSVSLYPLRAKQLTDLLTGSGFENIRSYGEFDRQEFLTDSSMVLVVTADKN